MDTDSFPFQLSPAGSKHRRPAEIRPRPPEAEPRRTRCRRRRRRRCCRKSRRPLRGHGGVSPPQRRGRGSCPPTGLWAVGCGLCAGGGRDLPTSSPARAQPAAPKRSEAAESLARVGQRCRGRCPRPGRDRQVERCSDTSGLCEGNLSFPALRVPPGSVRHLAARLRTERGVVGLGARRCPPFRAAV